MIMTTATDLSTGARLAFSQNEFDLICSDLRSVPLSRAAAASSAVPLAMSPVTINNYGGGCNYVPPYWCGSSRIPTTGSGPPANAAALARDEGVPGRREPPVPAPGRRRARRQPRRARGARVARGDGGSVALRASARHAAHPAHRRVRRQLALGAARRVGPQRAPAQRPRDPAQGDRRPIDRYSLEGVELLRDIVTRWETTPGAPNIELYAIDVSIDAHPDAAERAF
jgi:NTE family protein